MKKFTRRDFLKMLGGSLIGGVLSKWFAPSKAYAAKRSAGEGNHPLYDVKIVDSREVTGAGRKKILEEVAGYSDFRNVVGHRPVDLAFGDAKVVEHTLEGGNALQAIAIPLGRQQVVVYYRSLKPLVSKRKEGEVRFESAAYLLQVQDSVAEVETISINGRLVQPGKQRNSGDPCGGCVDPVWGPWEYQGWVCYSYDLRCLGKCCGYCAVQCLSGDETACLLCVAIWCPVCGSALCCSSGSWGCLSCGGAP